MAQVDLPNRGGSSENIDAWEGSGDTAKLSSLLSALLARNKNLEAFTLRSYQGQAKDWTLLMSSLEGKGSLQSMKWSGCHLGDTGGKALAELLEKTQGLTSIHITGAPRPYINYFHLMRLTLSFIF